MQRGSATGMHEKDMRTANDVGGHHHSHVPVRTQDERQTPISGLGGSLEPAPPAPIAAATENQQYDENDQKGCRVHVALLWTRGDHFTLGGRRWSG